MNFDQELIRWYVSAGIDRPSLDDRHVACAVFRRDSLRAIHDADKRLGIDPADLGSLAELVNAAEEHLALITRGVGQIRVEPWPTSRGESA